MKNDGVSHCMGKKEGNGSLPPIKKARLDHGEEGASWPEIPAIWWWKRPS
jgi:hypothetical protein